MATLTKETTALQDIIFAWAFESPAEWHSGLINAMADIRLEACYEEARAALEANGDSNIPTAKDQVIAEAYSRGLLKTLVQKQAEAEAEAEAAAMASQAAEMEE
jgi:hypothetical protein